MESNTYGVAGINRQGQKKSLQLDLPRPKYESLHFDFLVQSVVARCTVP